MKVLHVHTRYRERGGEDTVVEQERRMLSDAGLDVRSLDFTNPEGRSGTAKNLAKSPWNPSAADRVVDEAREHSSDVIHVHNTWFALSPAVVSKAARAGFPVVMTFHNYRLVCVNAMLFRNGAPCELCVGHSPLAGVVHRCYRDSLTASGLVALTIATHRVAGTWAEHLTMGLALTDFARHRLIRGGVPEDRIEVKPNFVVDPGPRTVAPSVSNQALFVGRLSAEKGAAQLIDAWRRPVLDEMELLIVGSGPEEERLRNSKVRNVKFMGRMTSGEVRALMLSARALIVPSRWFEGMPMVILEGLAAGLPVFHTDLGALGEVAGSGGVSLGPGDVATMGSELERLTDDSEIDRLGALARAEYEERFDEKRNLASLLDVYGRVSAGTVG